MAKEGKKEPISDLTKHNLKREEEVREATKRLDEYLVTKFDLNKPKSARRVSDEKTPQKEKPKTSEAKESERTAKSGEDKSDKKAEAKESGIKATEK